MSHFDDVDFVLWGPISLVGLVIAVPFIVWAIWADNDSATRCAEYGETYVDSRVGYTLCEQDGGTVVRR